VILALGTPKVDFFIKIIGITASIILNLIFLPRWGIIGAAVAHAASLILMDIMGLIMIRKYLKNIVPIKHIMTITSTSLMLFMLFYHKVYKVIMIDISVGYTITLLFGMIILNYMIILMLTKNDMREQFILSLIKKK
jgi:O-antigen/teichoic acid export membrane protein